MRRLLIPLALLVAFALPVNAQAQCYADYKAKKDNPLRLHYGIVQLEGACKRSSARAEVSARLDAGGWKLLNVLSVFGPEGLNKRRGNAGKFFLRF